jgi:hypothetical protein
MNFVNEKNSRHNFCTALFSPFGYLLVDLFTNFWLDLSNVSSE